MTARLGLIITDASLLITLGASGALDCLLLPNIPVFVPDMMYIEVTHGMARLGAGEVAAWIRAHEGQVQIIPTEVYADFDFDAVHLDTLLRPLYHTWTCLVILRRYGAIRHHLAEIKTCDVNQKMNSARPILAFLRQP